MMRKVRDDDNDDVMMKYRGTGIYSKMITGTVQKERQREARGKDATVHDRNKKTTELESKPE